MIADRPGPSFSEFLWRVRARPLSSWQLPGRTEAVRTALEELRRLCWSTAGRPGEPPVVPDLGMHAVADQLQVLVDDALENGAAPERIREVLEPLAGALKVRFD